MFSIEKCMVPVDSLLHNYSMNGAYADCYSTEIFGRVSLPEFIIAFYTTSLFKLERFILKLTVSKASTDDQVKQLADKEIEKFAAWTVENRRENEILLCDFLGRTRSWLMVVPGNAASGVRTRLYFGTAIVPMHISKTGGPSIGFGFQTLLGFHKIYSRLLLYFAKSNIRRRNLAINYQKVSK